NAPSRQLVWSFPKLNSDARTSAPVERDAQNLTVAKARPPSEPLNQRLGSSDFVNCVRHFAQDKLPLDGERHGVAAAEAQRRYSALQVAALQFVEQRYQYARARRANGMAQRDGAAIYIH